MAPVSQIFESQKRPLTVHSDSANIRVSEMNGGGAAEEEEMKPTKRVAMSRAVVEHFRAFADGSGTDCIVSCAGFRFSFNTLGEGKVTRHGIGGGGAGAPRAGAGAG